MKKGDLFQTEIEDIDINGNGIGRVEGFIFFVPGALPGETVRARAAKLNKNYGFAQLEEMLLPSPQRRGPFCRHYEKCGGCTLQHLSYAAQLEWKTNYVQSCLTRIGGIGAPISFTLPSRMEFRYRNKAAFPIGMNGLIKIGFYSQRSHDLLDIDDCPVQNQDVALLVSQLKTWIAHNKISVYDEKTGRGLLRHAVVRTAKNGDMMLTLCINGEDVPHRAELVATFRYVLPRLKSIALSINKRKNNTILGDRAVTIYGNDHITEHIMGLDFNIGPHSFLQVNATAAETLYNILFKMLDLKGTERIFDLFCGAGTITLPAAQRAKSVTGIEIVPEAVEDARRNARLNGIENATFIAGDVAAILSQALGNQKPDAIILDPPRKGVDASVVRACAQSGAKRIGYVSCNPSTLARDLKEFVSLGYSVSAVQPVDMFPQTTHVETVVLMSRMEK